MVVAVSGSGMRVVIGRNTGCLAKSLAILQGGVWGWKEPWRPVVNYRV